MFLYDSEAIRRKLQSVLASKQGRRYALVAFVGRDALDFVAEPRGLIVYCWDNVSATHPDGIRALIGEGAIVYFVDRLHMKLFWSERGGALLGSCNLTRNALGSGTIGLKEVAYFVADASTVAIDDLVKGLKGSRRLVTDAVLAAYRKKYQAAAARRDEFKSAGKKAATPPTPSFGKYLTLPKDQSWSIRCWEQVRKLEKGDLDAVRDFAADEGLSQDPTRFVRDALEAYARPQVGEWILCCKVGTNGRFGRLSWLYAHLVAKPRKNGARWSAIEVKKLGELPPFDCTEERFKTAFTKYATNASLLKAWELPMTATRLARLAAEYSSNKAG